MMGDLTDLFLVGDDTVALSLPGSVLAAMCLIVSIKKRRDCATRPVLLSLAT